MICRLRFSHNYYRYNDNESVTVIYTNAETDKAGTAGNDDIVPELFDHF